MIKNDCTLFQSIVSDDFLKVDRSINDQLCSQVALINQIGRYIINSGGKRLRPLLVLLSARACQYTGESHILLAVIIEFLHTATLLHDDVVDDSAKRRGQESAHMLWGNSASVLSGDFLYSRAFTLMMSLENNDILRMLANATSTIAEGEVMQLMNIRRIGITESEYLDVIRCKTAILFQASCQTAAALSNVSGSVCRYVSNYGLYLGMAFQLVDDALDYDGNVGETGKNIGEDFKEGKLTLPLIYALKEGGEAAVLLIQEALLEGGEGQIVEVTQAMRKCGALEYTYTKAEEYCTRAIDCLDYLPSNSYREAMEQLAYFITSRRY